jgi:hypothetical protein
LPNVTYWPSQRQAGTPTTNIQSTLSPSPDLCSKSVSLQCYLVATVIHIQSVRSQMCVCVCTHTHTHILNNMETLVGQNNKHGTAVNAACQGILSACRFGLAWQRFVSPFIELQFFPLRMVSPHSILTSSVCPSYHKEKREKPGNL